MCQSTAKGVMYGVPKEVHTHTNRFRWNRARRFAEALSEVQVPQGRQTCLRAVIMHDQEQQRHMLRGTFELELAS